MKKTQKNKAITLVALVITMVVLIILAGISINMLFGENGIITKAKLGKSKFLGEDAREVVEQRVAALKQENAQKGVDTTLYDFWFMYNSMELEDGTANPNYKDDMAIYLFTDTIGGKFKPKAEKAQSQKADSIANATATYRKETQYQTAIVVYADYVTAVDKDVIVSTNAMEIDSHEGLQDVLEAGTIINGGNLPADLKTAAKLEGLDIAKNKGNDFYDNTVVDLINAIPTSNINENYIFSASSEAFSETNTQYPGGSAAYRAFTGINNAGWGGNDDGSYGWLQIEFTKRSPILTKISLKSQCMGGIMGLPLGDGHYWRVYTVQIVGSNDGENWTDLSGVVDTRATVDVDTTMDIELENNTRYKFYRIKTLSSQSTYNGLSNIKLYGIR